SLTGKSRLFLLESVEGGEKWGRYSFLGFDPRAVIKVHGPAVTIEEGDVRTVIPHMGDPLEILKNYLKKYIPVSIEGLPRFFGGAVGFFHYEMARYFDRGINLPPSGENVEEAIFFLTDTLLIFDRNRHTLKIVVCAFLNGTDNLREEYDHSANRIEEITSLLTLANRREAPSPRTPVCSLASSCTPDHFIDMVKRAKEHIFAGDIIQVVISQRFQGECQISPADLYRALRYVNPSPYLFFFQDKDLALIGSSPEAMVRLEEGELELRPIAGTRPRGRDEKEDQKRADELLNDEKERAEHVMLVDLGRNDLGRISRIGSVQVNQLMRVERYSHVMHLVSSIRAQLEEGKDAFDVLKATFPAGTLSGAPKIRAMQIISELERMPRGPYGGAIGYFSFNGNMDFGITIRTIVLEGNILSIQAGAGIVADSEPEHELAETINKARGMMKALDLAASGFDLAEFQGGYYDTHD
ncbi:MAG: anthranilate synthase component I, partial [Smithellaceae bacterium]|nr:anthranilate synthase component I [Smithellaceae bacterium]